MWWLIDEETQIQFGNSPYLYHFFQELRGMFEMNCLFLFETSNFKLARKYSFHALEVLPVARNAKFQPMYPVLEGVTVR